MADFKVYTKGSGSGELKVAVKGPSKRKSRESSVVVSRLALMSSPSSAFPLGGAAEPVKVMEMDNGVFECSYYPVSRGKYVVGISWGGLNVPRR